MVSFSCIHIIPLGGTIFFLYTLILLLHTQACNLDAVDNRIMPLISSTFSSFFDVLLIKTASHCLTSDWIVM